MGAEAKRKTRRGKRGGDAKRPNDTDDTGVATQDTHQGQANAASTPAAGATGYVAPPMSSGDSLFFLDTNAQADNMEEQMEKVSPASYGLVNPDLQKYLKSCEGMLDEPKFETGEDRDIFVNNVYSEMKNFELQLTTDHECSRILEKLFHISSDYQIRRFAALTREDTIRLVVHRFSSHALQTMLLLSAGALERELRGECSDFDGSAEVDESSSNQAVRTVLPTFEELVLGLAETLSTRWSYLMSNEYASHILRVLLLVMAGKPIEDQSNPQSAIKSKRSTKYMEDKSNASMSQRSLTVSREVPTSFGPALERLLNTVGDAMGDVVARNFTNNAVGSPVLQLMVELQAGFTKTEYPGSILDKTLMNLASAGTTENPRRDSFIKVMLSDVVGSHFLQVIAKIASPQLLQAIYDRYMRGSLKTLSFHPISNFVVQSVFANAKNERQLKAMISEVAPIFSDLLFKNRAGVVRALIDSCVRLECGYIDLINALYNGLGVKSPEERMELINLLAFLIPYRNFVSADYSQLPFKVQGSLIIQSILQFPGDAQTPIMDSFFSQDIDRVISWCKDPSGSRIIEAIFKSPNVPFKSKQRVMERFSGRYTDLAMNKYSSHTVDACWEIADVEFKETVILEMVKNANLLQDNHFGRIVLRNCAFEQYKRRAEEWRERERGLERKKHMFKDILGSKIVTSDVKPAAAMSGAQKSATEDGSKASKKKTSKSSGADEIDSLFKKSHIRASSNDLKHNQPEQASNDISVAIDAKGDKNLEAVMSAISGTKRKSKSKSKSDKKDKEDKEESKSKKSKKSKEEDRKKRRAFVG
ncbi:Nucleolar protein 9 [Kickxella alabastrina]|uniref:Nucleolar protein 9 n=1 Tax=Kickxella alabastrina TaxID=61397 RepID=A0ACC1IBM2_9FUNG|nr:Nucleolar protein 9 [Kickxella alabastrina]